jgi:hypothetical protein
MDTILLLDACCHSDYPPHNLFAHFFGCCSSTFRLISQFSSRKLKKSAKIVHLSGYKSFTNGKFVTVPEPHKNNIYPEPQKYVCVFIQSECLFIVMGNRFYLLLFLENNDLGIYLRSFLGFLVYNFSIFIEKILSKSVEKSPKYTISYLFYMPFSYMPFCCSNFLFFDVIL